jgi:hypothetical protein
MIQPIPSPTDPKIPTFPPVQAEPKPLSGTVLDQDGAFDKAMEDIALQVAKEFWSEQDIKK